MTDEEEIELDNELDKQIIVEAQRLGCEEDPKRRASPGCKRMRTDENFTYDQFMNFEPPIFDYVEYFNDLNDLERFPDEPEISDMEYFALTDQNLLNSQALEWYACGTVVWQVEAAWKQYGEWELFWRKYLYDPNFKCLNGFASCNYQAPTMEAIKRRFPENRPLARRVLFITLMYGTAHQYSNALDVSVPSSYFGFPLFLTDFL